MFKFSFLFLNMTILHLNTSHFNVANGSTEGSKVLSCTLPGLVFVFFYVDYVDPTRQKKCDNCELLKPEFEQLSKKLEKSYFSFGAVNLNTHSEIAKKSMQTKIKINYVPYLILFVDGTPYLRYDGNASIQQMEYFLSIAYKEVLQKGYKPTAPRSGSSATAASKEDETPVFKGGGIPYNILCDKNSGLCYLTFDDLKKQKV
jgi:thiol-disulfide isomerase/thioredoxin